MSSENNGVNKAVIADDSNQETLFTWNITKNGGKVFLFAKISQKLLSLKFPLKRENLDNHSQENMLVDLIPVLTIWDQIYDVFTNASWNFFGLK